MKDTSSHSSSSSFVHTEELSWGTVVLSSPPPPTTTMKHSSTLNTLSDNNENDDTNDDDDDDFVDATCNTNSPSNNSISEQEASNNNNNLDEIFNIMHSTTPCLLVTNTIHYHSFQSSSTSSAVYTMLSNIFWVGWNTKCVICQERLFASTTEEEEEEDGTSWFHKKPPPPLYEFGMNYNKDGAIVKCVACGAYAHRACCFKNDLIEEKCPVNVLLIPPSLQCHEATMQDGGTIAKQSFNDCDEIKDQRQYDNDDGSSAIAYPNNHDSTSALKNEGKYPVNVLLVPPSLQCHTTTVTNEAVRSTISKQSFNDCDEIKNQRQYDNDGKT